MVIFFIREFNDVDHIVPVVYKMAKAGSEHIEVLCQNPFFDIYGDFRLRLLKENFSNVKIDYIYERFLPTPVHAFLALIINGHNFKSGIVTKILRFAFNKAWAKKFFTKCKARLLVFDHIEPEAYITGALLAAAKDLKISTVGLPNGLPLFSYGYKELPESYKRELEADLDYLVVPHERARKYRLDAGFKPERVKVLGSARFCEEWIEILHKAIPKDENVLPGEAPDNKLKVVYVERGLDLYGEHKYKVKSALKKLGELDFVDLVIKPHTRAKNLHFEGLPESVKIANAANSVNLIRWADVVIGTVSSILVEAFVQGKIFIYPKFFTDERMLFEETGACWAVRSVEELEEALGMIKSGSVKNPYPRENVLRFLNEAVYGGSFGRDVLGGYEKFIRAVSLQNGESFERENIGESLKSGIDLVKIKP